MTLLEKRLLACMQLGITIEYADGHRWICFAEDGNIHDFNFELEYIKRTKNSVNTKVYGYLEAALDKIDKMLDEMGEQSLEKRFDSMQMSESYAYGIDI